MSASAQIIPTAIGQLRQGYISSITNKSDPFNAITFLMAMAAILPPDARPKKEKVEEGMPKEAKEWVDDPEETEFQKGTWEYVRKLVVLVEEAFSEYITNYMAGRDFR